MHCRITSKKNALQYIGCGFLLLYIHFNPLFAQTSKNCSPWVPTIEEYYSNGKRVTRKPEFLKLRKAALTIDGLVKKNPHFASISPARFRSSMVLTNGKPQSLLLNIKAYSKDGWDNKCGIIPQADRIAADDAGIRVAINHTGFHYTALEESPTQDEKLKAFKEPVVTKKMGGQPLYYQSSGNHFLLMTYNDESPWEPVTMEEYLDYIERRLVKKIKDFEADNKSKHGPVVVKDPKKNAYYLELKKTDPKGAAEFLALAENMQKQTEINNQAAAQLRADGETELKKDLSDFKALRATYSAADLKKQAIRGNSKFWLYNKDYPNLKDSLVKIKREFLADPANSNRIKIISIWAGGSNPEWNEHIEKAMETLDYQAIKRLMK